MQKPSVGRIVHFNKGDGTVEAGLIVHVHNETCVNLVVWNAGGTQRVESSRELGDQPNTWAWPART